ncbi:ParB/RepB/Spo0J family partition protein [Thermobifida cellulosilytica]|uniref:Chromosomal partitioning protein ParB n=1 Tax=Thermobifida cellulosilytica TB100 TaxID=665004 RepID=A0A147KLS9_THECS|nr:ParB/RepB/Spo0J family partition protein [Thermobifida cellulosilytica]KUP98209.1 chromosomal partitioning protein ParB [Thermobifida cellulosilytica TB100]
MSQQRRGLGKGLGALIPQGPSMAVAGVNRDHPGAGQTVNGAYLEEIPLDAITPNPRQPRHHFDEEALEELTASIAEVGLLQPVVVRKTNRGVGADAKYELIMGERRWRASQRAGLERIPAIVRETPDNEMLRDALLENLHRQELNPLEEAAAYQQLLDDFGVTHEELAKRIGRSRPHISNTLRLLNLPPSVQSKVAARVISAGHARALLSVEDPEQQEHLAHRIIAESLSVRALEEIIALGETEPPAKRRKPARREASPELEEVANRLSDLLDTRVKVNMGRNKGKIVVEFATKEDLERILAAMAPGAAGSN